MSDAASAPVHVAAAPNPRFLLLQMPRSLPRHSISATAVTQVQVLTLEALDLWRRRGVSSLRCGQDFHLSIVRRYAAAPTRPPASGAVVMEGPLEAAAADGMARALEADGQGKHGWLPPFAV
jgi:hypothetical protein